LNGKEGRSPFGLVQAFAAAASSYNNTPIPLISS
jgi:hypothetical protein